MRHNPSSDTSILAELEGHTDQLVAAVKSLVDYRRAIDSSDQSGVNADVDKELNKAKSNILASAAGIKTLLSGPADFLQDLARQVEILACLQWLAGFQILACIPLDENLPVKDLADLAGVPKSQLDRVIRLTATCGFLQEPMPGFVSHTPLSAQFISNQSLLDATTFMAETTAPTALQMLSATQRFGSAPNASKSAFNLALNTTRSFHVAVQERSKLGRQWSAYLCHAAGLHQEEEVVDVLSRLNWSNLGNACIVEVGAQSTSMARSLAKRFPSLSLVVQIDNVQSSSLDPDWMWQSAMLGRRVPDITSFSSDSTSPRITVTYRTAAMPQPVTDAAVYILHLPVASPGSLGASVGLRVRAELEDYLGVLRVSGGLMLVLTARLLPEPGSLPCPEVEAVARARDLSMLQLANEGEMEMADLLSILKTVGDSAGKLVITNHLRSHNGLILAITIQYQAY